jgi:hypothetical protein
MRFYQTTRYCYQQKEDVEIQLQQQYSGLRWRKFVAFQVGAEGKDRLLHRWYVENLHLEKHHQQVQ